MNMLDALIESLNNSIPCNSQSRANQKLAKRLEKEVADYFKALSIAFPYTELEYLYYKYIKESIGGESDEMVSSVLRALNTSFKAKVAGHLTTIYISGSAEMMDYGGLAYEGIPDAKVIGWAEKHSAQLVTGMDKETKNRLSKVIADGIKNKRGPGGLTTDIKRELGWMGRGRPSAIKGLTMQSRASLIARTETANALGKAFMDRGKEMGIEGKSWITAGDDNVSDGCLENEGAGVIPFNDVFPSGDETPPRFPGCYSDDTEVYTEKGWRKIKNVSIGDVVYSLNPKTLKLEKAVTVNTISHPAEKLVNFKSKRLDLLVTGNHKMFLQSDYDRKRKKEIYKFREASEFVGKKSGRFFAGLNWVGKDRKEIEIGSYKIPTETYCKFMGFYLSEGSVSKLSKGKGWNIKISQSKEKHPEVFKAIEETVREMPGKWWIGKEAIYTSNEDLCEYVQQFKKCSEKFVPEDIKSLPVDKIKIFLEAYCMGDGHKRKPRKFNGSMCVSEISYYTSSKRMADDLGELILKIGKRPTFYIRKTKGILQHFKNGDYINNHDSISVREVNTVHHNLKSMDIEFKAYSGYAHCIELNKNHVMLVRRNGKVVWCGNCRCAAAPERL